MRNIKVNKLIIGVILSMLILSGCSKERQVEKHFEEILSMYPTSNLEDWYEREGYRDDDFSPNDKGTWILRSSTSIPNGDKLISEGMVLKLNRNTKKATGYYFITDLFEDEKGFAQKKGREYPVKMEKNKIILTKEVNDVKLKTKIENFKFFSQYGKFKDLKEYGEGDITYNPNVPSYSAEYQLTNEDDNVKEIRKRFNIQGKKAPELELKGTGDLKGSSVGYRTLQYKFKKNDDLLFVRDSVVYNPS